MKPMERECRRLNIYAYLHQAAPVIKQLATLNRRRTNRIVSLAIAILLGFAAMAQECLAPGSPITSTNDIQNLWGSDQRYAVYKLSEKSYLIRGDSVHLEASSFPSLSREPGTTNTEVISIEIDAREIILDMPILVENAKLKLYAEIVRFTWNGYIGITSPPTDVEQGVEIQTRTLDLSDSRTTPFNFSTQDWTLPPGQQQWPLTTGPKRTIVVRAGEVIPSRWLDDLGRSILTYDSTRFFHNLSQDRGRSAGFADWNLGYDIVTGPDGEASYNQLLATKLRWPEYTLQKLRRIYARDPYNPVVQSFVLELINRFEKRFALSDSSYAQGELSQLKTLTTQGQDLFGFSSEDVPMRDMQEQLDEFKDRLVTLFGSPDTNSSGLITLLDQQLLGSLDTGTVDQNLIQKASAEVLALRETIQSNEQILNGLQTERAQLAQEVSNTEILVEQRLTQRVEDWKHEAEEAIRLGKDLAIVGKAAVAVSVLYPPAAPIALTVNQALEMTTQVQCEELTGDVSLNETLSFLAETNKRREAYKKLLDEAQQAYKKGKGNFDTAWDFVTGDDRSAEAKKGLGDFSNAVGSYGSKVKELYQELSKPRCTDSLTIPTFENDSIIISHQEQLATLLAKDSELLQQELTLMDVQLLSQSEILQKQLLLSEIQALDLRNEEERVRYQELSAEIKRQLLSDLLFRAAQLRRSFQYLSGNLESLPSNLVILPDDFSRVQLGDIPSSEPEQIAATLQQERENAKTYLWSFHELFEQALIQLNSRLQKSLPDNDRFTAQQSGPGREELNAGFLEALNAAITQSWESRGSPPHPPISIPYQRTPTGRPEFFVGAIVRAIAFSSDSPRLNNREIEFEISHSGFGRLHFGETCLNARSASDLSMPIPPISFTKDEQVEEWRSHLASWQQFVDLREYAFPYDGLYYLTVRFPQPEAWSKPPTVERIEIDFVKRGLNP